MSWKSDLMLADALLAETRPPALDTILSLIKRINPTTLTLSEQDRERGYQVKNQLQNLLLENYGEYFHLLPHPYLRDIILIKHKMLPTIDACHGLLRNLSPGALAAVDEQAVRAPVKLAVRARRGKCKPGETTLAASAKELVKRARALLDEYDYEGAAKTLAGIVVKGSNELPALIKAAEMLTYEMAAYQLTIETLQRQPREVKNDRVLREILAGAYFQNSMFPEARAILETLNPAELGKSTLCSYARLAFGDGNVLLANNLLQIAAAKDGLVPELAEMREEVQGALLKEAEPALAEAEAAFARNDFEVARQWAREALSCCPGCPRARELLAEMESQHAEEQLAELWRRYRGAGPGQERLQLLAKLLEREPKNREEIRSLIEREKDTLRRENVEARMRALSQCAARQAWPECFEHLIWFMAQEQIADLLPQLDGLSGYFSALCRNRKVLRHPDQSIKESWLAFIELCESVRAGRTCGCLEPLERLRHLFGWHPLFKEHHRVVLHAEQQAARVKAGELMAHLEGEGAAPEQKGTTADSLRKAVQILPAPERAPYLAALERHLGQQKVPKSQETLLEEYRMALELGNCAKASCLAESITDRQARQQVDDEVAGRFRIETQPVKLGLCPELRLDPIGTGGPLHAIGSSGSLVFLADDCGTMVLVDLKQMTATRYRSPNFNGLSLLDALPDQESYLFFDRKGQELIWRAQLGAKEAAFTAVINVAETFGTPCKEIEWVMMSHGNELQYVVTVKGKRVERRPKVLAYDLSDGCNVIGRQQLSGSGHVRIRRLSADPERFLLVSNKDIRICNGELDKVRIQYFPKANPAEIYAVDAEKGEVYLSYMARLSVFDFQLGLTRNYVGSICTAFFEHWYVGGVCVETGSILYRMHVGRGILYNADRNEFSNTFSAANILCTEPASAWYYFEYDEGRSELRIKDVTLELEGLFEWQVLFADPGSGPAPSMDGIHQLGNKDFFAYQGAGPTSTTAQATPPPTPLCQDRCRLSSEVLC